jgi:hypothetical protein
LPDLFDDIGEAANCHDAEIVRAHQHDLVFQMRSIRFPSMHVQASVASR